MPKETKSKESKASRISAPTRRSAAAATAVIDKKKRGKKAAPAVKRGLSAYMFFSQENRAKVQQENPDAAFGQIGKILGEKWKNMNDAEKKPYLEKAEADKKRYEAEKAKQANSEDD